VLTTQVLSLFIGTLRPGAIAAFNDAVEQVRRVRFFLFKPTG